MAKYRKIDLRIWNDERFRRLQHNAQVAFAFVLTHSAMTCLGAMQAAGIRR